MNSGYSDPPYGEGIDHIDLTETHRRNNKIKAGLHELSDSGLDKLVGNLIRLFSKNGTKRSLTQLTTHAFLCANVLRKQSESVVDPLSRREVIQDEEDPGLPPRLIEYAIAVTLQTDTETTEPVPFDTIADNLLAILNWFSRAQDSQIGPKVGGNNLKILSAHAILHRQLSYRRFVDGRQYIEKAYRAYKPFELEMEESLGFSIEDVVYYTDSLGDLIIDQSARKAKDQLRYTDSLLNIDGELYDIGFDQLWVDRETLTEYCDGSDRFQSLLDRLTCSPDPSNAYRYPWEINPLRINPIIRYQEKYLLPVPGILAFAIAHTFYYDLIDMDVSGEFGDSLGDYLEEWTLECLRKVFQPDELSESVSYSSNGVQGESDVVVLQDSTLIVIECKSKKLTAETQKGEFGGLEVIEADLKQSIGEGYEQADRFISGVETGSITSVTMQDGQSASVNPDEIDTYIRCILLGEAFDSIATRDFAHFLEFDPIPYVLDIFDLQIITHVLDTPEQFVKYANGRIQLTEKQTNRNQYSYMTDIHSPDEIDYLAYFLQKGGEFPSVRRNIMGAGDDLRDQSVTEMLEDGEMSSFYDF